MFYIYHFYKATSDYLVWYQFSPIRKFTNTRDCETYLKHLGYSLSEISRSFCYRWFAGIANPMIIEYKSAVQYGR